mgnify:CR=1 FL=1
MLTGIPIASVHSKTTNLDSRIIRPMLRPTKFVFDFFEETLGKQRLTVFLTFNLRNFII